MKRFFPFFFAGSLLSVSYTAFALNGADLGLSHGEVEAAYTTVSPDSLTRSYVSSGQSMPRKEIRLSDSACRTDPFDNGGHCIKLAGGGAFGEVSAVNFFWRLSGKGHNAVWEPCIKMNGCRAFSHHVYPDGRTVATFLISHVYPDGDRDLRMDVVFKNVLTPPVPKMAKDMILERTSNRVGKYN